MTVVIIGCDPGLDGALALIVKGEFILVEDMPVFDKGGKVRLDFDTEGNPVERRGVDRDIDLDALCTLLRKWKDATRALSSNKPPLFVVERVWWRPDQGGVTQAKMIRAAALAEGVAAGIGMGVSVIAPSSWKAAMGVSASKGTSLDLARSLIGTNDPKKLDRFKRKKDDGRAEAYLIGMWAWNGGKGR